MNWTRRICKWRDERERKYQRVSWRNHLCSFLIHRANDLNDFMENANKDERRWEDDVKNRWLNRRFWCFRDNMEWNCRTGSEGFRCKCLVSIDLANCASAHPITLGVQNLFARNKKARKQIDETSINNSTTKAQNGSLWTEERISA